MTSIPWKGGGERGARWLCAWTATRDKRSSQMGLGGGGWDPPSSEGSACMFASDPETRGEEGLYCSHVLARWNLSQLLWNLQLGFFSFFPGENSNVFCCRLVLSFLKQGTQLFWYYHSKTGSVANLICESITEINRLFLLFQLILSGEI